MEIFKNAIARQNKINDKRFDKIALVVERIWDCNRAFQRVLTNAVKRAGEGPFTGIADLIEEDPDFKMKLESDYHASVGDFGTAVSELKATVDSSGFWLGLDLSLKAQEIADGFLIINYAFTNNDEEGKGADVFARIDSMISSFEIEANKYLA